MADTNLSYLQNGNLSRKKLDGSIKINNSSFAAVAKLITELRRNVISDKVVCYLFTSRSIL